MIKNLFIKRASLLIILLLVIGTTIYSQQSKTRAEVVVKIPTYNTKARFSRKNPVNYKVQFINNLRDVQQGSLVYTIFDMNGRKVYDHKFDVLLKKYSALTLKFL